VRHRKKHSPSHGRGKSPSRRVARHRLDTIDKIVFGGNRRTSKSASYLPHAHPSPDPQRSSPKDCVMLTLCWSREKEKERNKNLFHRKKGNFFSLLFFSLCLCVNASNEVTNRCQHRSETSPKENNTHDTSATSESETKRKKKKKKIFFSCPSIFFFLFSFLFSFDQPSFRSQSPYSFR